MKKIISICGALALSFTLMAQGGISDQMLNQIRKGYQDTPQERALRNAISANDINKLAVNSTVKATNDFYFSHEVK